MADIHEKLSYLKATVKYGEIEDHRDMLLGRLEALRNFRTNIKEYKKICETDKTDWEILCHLKDADLTPDMKMLIEAVDQCEQLLDIDDKITIWINSGGGNIIDGLAVIDMIDSCEFPVEMIATGEIQSMAIPLIASGTKGYRFATKNTIFMMHDSACGAYGGSSELTATTGFLKMLDKKIKSIILKRTNIKSKEYDQYNKYTPYYFDAKKALEHGIIDGII
jgi:ATP-dependent Clp protease protease subunit